MKIPIFGMLESWITAFLKADKAAMYRFCTERLLLMRLTTFSDLVESINY